MIAALKKQLSVPDVVVEEEPAVPANNAVARYKARQELKRLKRERKRAIRSGHIVPDAVVSGKVVENNTVVAKNVVVFTEDGYKHPSCPVGLLYEPELNSILDDVLYCLEVSALPAVGGAFDQSEIFRLAYITIKTEREIIKSEKEEAAIADAKKKGNKQPKKSGRRR